MIRSPNTAHGRGRPVPASVLPSWRLGQSAGEWREITGSSPSLCIPTVDLSFGSPSKITDAWGGLSIDTRTDDIWVLAGGGHADYAGNELRVCRMSVDAPAWVERYRCDASWQPDVPYYSPSGHPQSAHCYYQQQFCEARNRAMRFGAYGGTGASLYYPSVDGFNSTLAVGVDGYDPAGTYPDIPGIYPDNATCKDPRNEDVWIFQSNAYIARWNQVANTMDTLTTDISVTYSGCGSAFDTLRNRIFLLSASTCITIDPADPTAESLRTLTGDYDTFFIDNNEYQLGVIYEPALDAFLVRRRASGGAIYKIDAGTFATSLLTTTDGDSLPAAADSSAGGPYNRFLYSPNLSGVFWLPKHADNFWFCRTH